MLPDTQNKAISVRQPYAEQTMCGTKIIEYRSTRTHIRGRVYIYASLTISYPADFRKLTVLPGELPTSIIIDPIKPHNHPQPAWFIPCNSEL